MGLGEGGGNLLDVFLDRFTAFSRDLLESANKNILLFIDRKLDLCFGPPVAAGFVNAGDILSER